MNNWIVYTCPTFNHPVPFRIITRFGTESEAQMHAQGLNRICRTMSYKVRFLKQNQVLR